MTFDPQPTIQRIPTEIRTVEVTLFDGLYKEDHPYGKKWARAQIRVDDQLGQTVKHLHIDLSNHLSPAMIQQLIDFMDFLRNKAETEILPP